MLLNHTNILDIRFLMTYIMKFIYSNIKQLYKQSYAISYNFKHCFKDSKIIIFKTFISNIYLSSIRIPKIYCMANPKRAYNNAYHTLLNYRCKNSLSLIFTNDY